MVTRSPFMVLLAEQARHSTPTFLRAAMNASRFIAGRFPKSNLARKVYHGFRNWYEGGWPIFTGGNYSYLPSLVQDARWDQNYVTRREMLRRMRYWSQNSAILEAVISIGERYTVGPSGLHVSFYPEDATEEIAAAGQSTWYDRAERVVQEWFKACGWNGESMERLLKIGYRDQKVDGEMFYLKTRRLGAVAVGDRTVKVFKPCLQMVEAHRVFSPWNKFGEEGDTLIDGVQFKVTNQGSRKILEKVGYFVCDSMGTFYEQGDTFTLLGLDDVFHIFNAHRANQYRGLSDFYACAVDLNKLEDLIEIELKAQNTQSIRAVGFKSASGQLNPLDRKIEILNKARGLAPAPVTGDADLAKRCEVFSKETGAYAFGMKLNEEVENLAPNRPSQATLQLWEFLINCVCSAGHVPRCLVMQKLSGESARAQGTEVRAELDAADAYFKGDYQKWKDFVKSAVVWFMEWAVNNDPRVADPPPDWRDCLHIQQPEACNVDAGYTTQAQLMKLAAGASDYDMILGPQGVSFMTVVRRLARQQKVMESLGVKVTLPALMPGQIPLDGGRQPKPEEADK